MNLLISIYQLAKKSIFLGFVITGVSVGTAFGGKKEPVFAPDSVLLKDGREIHGVIVKNTNTTVILQEALGEKTYQKSEIVRIRDNDDTATYFTAVQKTGSLPSWRVIANDLRTHDDVKQVVQVPAVRIDDGPFYNIPYLTFRINHAIEMNIFGNPENPAGLEIGLYGGRKYDLAQRQRLRAHLAGFLNSREELAAYYSLNLRKAGKVQAGELTMETIPPSNPSAHGTWWLALYREKELAALRLSPEEYATHVVPPEAVKERRGRLPEKALGGSIVAQSKTLVKTGVVLGQQLEQEIGNGAQGLVKAGGFVGKTLGQGAQGLVKSGSVVTQELGKGALGIFKFGATLGSGAQSYMNGFFRDAKGQLQFFLPPLRSSPQNEGTVPPKEKAQ